MAVHWKCPTCGHAATIREQDYTSGAVGLRPRYGKDEKGYAGISYSYVRCPNAECKSFELIVRHVNMIYNTRGEDGVGGVISSWRFFPRSKAQVFPDYVPQGVKDDYEEASLIVELSPKASATLSRRCLQGILRDFWKVKPGRLVDEIAEIQSRCDPLTWSAIDAVRKVGNIGAHMEADVNVIVDVEPGEADLLIKLIETVVRDWYVAMEERKKQLSAVVALAARKEAEKKAAKAAATKPSPPGP